MGTELRNVKEFTNTSSMTSLNEKERGSPEMSPRGFNLVLECSPRSFQEEAGMCEASRAPDSAP